MALIKLNNQSLANVTSASSLALTSSNMPSGSVLQVQYRKITTSVFSTTSTSMVDWTGAYVDITPNFSDSILIWQTSLVMNSNTAGQYARFRIVDALNSDTQWSSNSYMGYYGYYTGTSEYNDVPLMHANTSGTTNAMQLQLQVLVTGGTLQDNWSAAEDRTITVTEIKA